MIDKILKPVRDAIKLVKLAHSEDTVGLDLCEWEDR